MSPSASTLHASGDICGVPSRRYVCITAWWCSRTKSSARVTSMPRPYRRRSDRAWESGAQLGPVGTPIALHERAAVLAGALHDETRRHLGEEAGGRVVAIGVHGPDRRTGYAGEASQHLGRGSE